MPHIPLSFPCRYCSQTFKTSKGRSNHLSQSKDCHELLIKASATLERLKRRNESLEDAESLKGNDDDLSSITDGTQQQLKRRRPLSQDTESQNGHDDTSSSIMDVFDGTWEQRSSRENSEVRVVESSDGKDDLPNFDHQVPSVDSSSDSHSEPEVDSDNQDDYIEDFPWSVGEPTGKTKRTAFEKIRATQENDQEEAWGPFKDEEEWDLARWLMTSTCSQTKMDEFLMLPIVCTIYLDEHWTDLLNR